MQTITLSRTKIAIFFFLGTLLLYCNTVNHSYTVDDHIVVMHNRFVQQGIEGMRSICTKGFFYGYNSDNTGELP